MLQIKLLLVQICLKLLHTSRYSTFQEKVENILINQIIFPSPQIYLKFSNILGQIFFTLRKIVRYSNSLKIFFFHLKCVLHSQIPQITSCTPLDSQSTLLSARNTLNSAKQAFYFLRQSS